MADIEQSMDIVDFCEDGYKIKNQIYAQIIAFLDCKNMVF